MKLLFPGKYIVMAVIGLLCTPKFTYAYAVLTHEAIVDAAWEKSFVPLLQSRYPGIKEAQLNEAHAYAYGGAIAPDMGYFPFGSRLFTDLVHYVRSGDFVNALLDEAAGINEYAFALGFMSHYMADQYGHLLATNRTVPIIYPKLMKEFGRVVTYNDDHLSHSRVEFSFDVLQTARGNYASKAYHEFIGFNISSDLLERAFRKIYALEISDLFKNLSLAIETLRWSVMSLFPMLTRAAWQIKKNEILRSQPDASIRSFRFRMERRNYYQDSGKIHRAPGFFTKALSWVIRTMPKIGPLRALKIKTPGPDAEKLFMQSFDTVLANCSAAMKIMESGDVRFPNIDFDTGQPTTPGEYDPVDLNYNKLLLVLTKKRFRHISAGLKTELLDYYHHPAVAIVTRHGAREGKKVYGALEKLKLISPEFQPGQ